VSSDYPSAGRYWAKPVATMRLCRVYRNGHDSTSVPTREAAMNKQSLDELTRENERLGAENRRLKTENEWLKQEIKRLRGEVNAAAG